MKRILITLVICTALLQSCEKENQVIPFHELPTLSQEFINTHFSDAKIAYITKDTEIFDKTYEVYFANGNHIDFSKNGYWEEIDCGFNAIPSSIIDLKIQTFVTSHHSREQIVQIEKSKNHYDVELNNDLELEFDLSFNFIRYKD